MKLKSFDKYLKTRLSEEEIKQIKEEAKMEAMTPEEKGKALKKWMSCSPLYIDITPEEIDRGNAVLKEIDTQFFPIFKGMEEYLLVRAMGKYKQAYGNNDFDTGVNAVEKFVVQQCDFLRKERAFLDEEKRKRERESQELLELIKEDLEKLDLPDNTLNEDGAMVSFPIPEKLQEALKKLGKE